MEVVDNFKKGKENMERKNIVETLFKGLAKGGEQQLFNQIRRLVRGLKEKFPGLEADKAWEKVFWIAEPVARTFLETMLPKGSIWTRAFDKFMEEFNQEVNVPLGGKNEPKPATAKTHGEGAKAMESIPKVWMNGKDYPGIGFHSECPATHWIGRQIKQRPRRGGGTEDYEAEAHRFGFRQVSFEAFVLSGARAPQIEGERINPGDTGELFVPETCACEKLFERDLGLFNRQQAAKAEAEARTKAAATPKPKGQLIVTAQEVRDGFAAVGNAVRGTFRGAKKLKTDTLTAIDTNAKMFADRQQKKRDALRVRIAQLRGQQP